VVLAASLALVQVQTSPSLYALAACLVTRAASLVVNYCIRCRHHIPFSGCRPFVSSGTWTTTSRYSCCDGSGRPRTIVSRPSLSPPTRLLVLRLMFLSLSPLHIFWLAGYGLGQRLVLVLVLDLDPLPPMKMPGEERSSLWLDLVAHICACFPKGTGCMYAFGRSHVAEGYINASDGPALVDQASVPVTLYRGGMRLPTPSSPLPPFLAPRIRG
jgi:hypothetical protein